MMKKASGIILLYLVGTALSILRTDLYEFGTNTVENTVKLAEGNSQTRSINPGRPFVFYGSFEVQFTVS